MKVRFPNKLKTAIIGISSGILQE